MRKIITLVLCIGLAFTSCEYHNLANCYHGKVIITSCCSGSTFINLDSSTPIGKKNKLNGQDYSNVIQVPGFLNQSEVYLNLRGFDSDKDFNLFPPKQSYCLGDCLIAVGTDVPFFVATAVSYSSCPK